MRKTKQKVKIKIVIKFEDEAGFHNSLDEAVSKIFNGYREGFDSNSEQSYHFKVY